MEAKIRTGDLLITRAAAVGTVFHLTGRYRDDFQCTDVRVPPIRDFPERCFWLTPKTIENTWASCTVDDFKEECLTKFDEDSHDEIKKERPMVHIEYMVDPEQGRVVTKITPK